MLESELKIIRKLQHFKIFVYYFVIIKFNTINTNYSYFNEERLICKINFKRYIYITFNKPISLP